jgi:signal recognition particle protein
VPEVNRLLKQFKEMQTQMKKFRSSKMLRMLGASKGALPMGKLPFK